MSCLYNSNFLAMDLSVIFLSVVYRFLGNNRFSKQNYFIKCAICDTFNGAKKFVAGNINQFDSIKGFLYIYLSLNYI